MKARRATDRIIFTTPISGSVSARRELSGINMHWASDIFYGDKWLLEVVPDCGSTFDWRCISYVAGTQLPVPVTEACRREYREPAVYANAGNGGKYDWRCFVD